MRRIQASSHEAKEKYHLRIDQTDNAHTSFRLLVANSGELLTKGHARGKEADRVDIMVVPAKGLLALAIPHVPQLGRGVTRA